MSLYPLIKLQNKKWKLPNFYRGKCLKQALAPFISSLMRDDADQTHQHRKWSSRFITVSPRLVCLSYTVTRTSTSKIMKNGPRGILFNKPQSMFGFSLVEFVLSGCRGGAERVQGRRAFARTPVGSWGSGACGQNHQLLPDVIRSLQQLCLDSPGTHKHTAGKGIRAQNMNHNQKE